MVERHYRPKVGDAPSAPIGLMQEMFDPSMASGHAIKGGGITEADIGGLLSGGGEYGLTAWEDLFDEQGNITDIQALLRSMNLGSIMQQDPSRGTGNPGTKSQSGIFNYGGGASPHSTYGTGTTDLEKWLHSLGYQGVEAGSNWLGQTRRDTPGQWYNPESLWFTGEGMDLETATRASLNQWAKDTYGVPLQHLAAWSPEVHETMKSWHADPSQWWNPETRSLDVTTIPGMGGVSSGAGMTAFGAAYDNLMAQQGRRADTALSQLQQRAMIGNPDYDRSAQGHGIGTQVALGGPYQQGMRTMAPRPMDYQGYMAMEMAPYNQMQAMNQYWAQYAK